MKLKIKALCQSTAGVAKLRSTPPYTKIISHEQHAKFYSSSPTKDGSPYNIKHITSMFCLFVVLRPTPEFFTHGDVTITGEALQILTYPWHLWPYSVPHLCDHLPTTRNTHICCQVFGSGPVTTCFYDFGLSWLGFEHHTFCMQGPCSSRLHHCDGWTLWVTH